MFIILILILYIFIFISYIHIKSNQINHQPLILYLHLLPIIIIIIFWASLLKKMIRSRFSMQPITGATTTITADHTNAATSRSVPHSLSFHFSPINLPLRSRHSRFHKPRSFLISCNSSLSRSNFSDHHNNNNENDFLEASILLSGPLSFSHSFSSFISGCSVTLFNVFIEIMKFIK